MQTDNDDQTPNKAFELAIEQEDHLLIAKMIREKKVTISKIADTIYILLYHKPSHAPVINWECLKTIIENQPAYSENAELDTQYAELRIEYDAVLIHAIIRNKLQILELLFKQGMKPSLHQALMYAPKETQKEIIQLFINNGADPDEVNSKGETLDNGCTTNEDCNFMANLAEITNKGDYNKQRYGQALYFAIHNKDYDTVVRLLKANVNKDWQWDLYYDFNHLHYAIAVKDVKAITILLSFGYDLDRIKDQKRRTPKELAKSLDEENGNSEYTTAMMQAIEIYTKHSLIALAQAYRQFRFTTPVLPKDQLHIGTSSEESKIPNLSPRLFNKLNNLGLITMIEPAPENKKEPKSPKRN